MMQNMNFDNTFMMDLTIHYETIEKRFSFSKIAIVKFFSPKGNYA